MRKRYRRAADGARAARPRRRGAAGQLPRRGLGRARRGCSARAAPRSPTSPGRGCRACRRRWSTPTRGCCSPRPAASAPTGGWRRRSPATRRVESLSLERDAGGRRPSRAAAAHGARRPLELPVAAVGRARCARRSSATPSRPSVASAPPVAPDVLAGGLDPAARRRRHRRRRDACSWPGTAATHRRPSPWPPSSGCSSPASSPATPIRSRPTSSSGPRWRWRSRSSPGCAAPRTGWSPAATTWSPARSPSASTAGTASAPRPPACSARSPPCGVLAHRARWARRSSSAARTCASRRSSCGRWWRRPSPAVVTRRWPTLADIAVIAARRKGLRPLQELAELARTADHRRRHGGRRHRRARSPPSAVESIDGRPVRPPRCGSGASGASTSTTATSPSTSPSCARGPAACCGCSP